MLKKNDPMRPKLAVFALLCGFAAEAQNRGAVFVAPPSPGPAVRPHRPPLVIGGWGWGWNWWNLEPARPLARPESRPEIVAPAHVLNKEYVAERLNPRMTEIAAAPATAPEIEWKPCALELTTKESFQAALCAELDDVVLLKARTGRRYRFSRDLVAAIR